MSYTVKKIAILISGRGSNMEALIEASSFFNYKVAIVISDNKEAKGLETAKTKGVKSVFVDPLTTKPFLKGKAEENYIKILKENNVDLIVLAGFMRILKDRFIDEFAGKILNIHPSLLPSFPGLDVHRKAIDYGVKYSGCTVHFVDKGVDSGPIVMQAVVPVKNDDTPETLADRILREEHRIYPASVYMVLNNFYRIEGRKVILDEEKLRFYNI